MLVSTRTLDNEIGDFLEAEVSTHLADIRSLNPPPPTVVGAGSTGEYTWGTFMRALGAYAEFSGRHQLGGRDLAREVAQIGLLEYRLGGTRFSQLYAALALRHFGRDLNTNPVWQSLSATEQAQWRKLLDVSAFYDPKTQQVINLPENYLGVAARIASITFQLGLLKDRQLLNGVISRAARPFEDGKIYADDSPPTGRFDRYSNEYARFVWDAAEAAERKDILDQLRPSLKTQMRLWWDLVLPDGYGYAWGRSLGVVSYLDTMEIVAFLARHAEFRPAPLEQLLSAYYQAWSWLRRDYRDNAHLLSIFSYGRGNFAYITKEREWQQTTGFFGKTSLSHKILADALSVDKVDSFPRDITRPDLARFEFFRRGERPAGVWLVRRGRLYFTLPITTGTKPGIADYLPAPHGLPGFAAPVEQIYPALVPFIELMDGRVLVAADGADEIEPGPDGLSLRARWRRWSLIGGKSGEFVDPGIAGQVSWRITGSTLNREETLHTQVPISLRRWWLALPTSTTQNEVLDGGELLEDLFSSEEDVIRVRASASWKLKRTLQAAGDTPKGRGPRKPLPLHVVYETNGLRLSPSQPAWFRLALTVEGRAGND